MFTTLAILLLLLFALAFWLVKESNIPSWVKIATITLFFSFCVMVAINFESSMGWAANGKKLEGIITIRSIVIKEPNQEQNFAGSIYFLLERPSTKSDAVLLNLFDHKTESIEPRLYKLPYSRKLHESLQKFVIPKLMKGQSVKGRFSRNGSEEGSMDGGGDGSGEGNGNGKKGGLRGAGKGNGRGRGSESPELNDPMFYELPPSYFQEKH
jgi:uncharacterized membrane protein YgcG